MAIFIEDSGLSIKHGQQPIDRINEIKSEEGWVDASVSGWKERIAKSE